MHACFNVSSGSRLGLAGTTSGDFDFPTVHLARLGPLTCFRPHRPYSSRTALGWRLQPPKDQPQPAPTLTPKAKWHEDSQAKIIVLMRDQLGYDVCTARGGDSQELHNLASCRSTPG